MSEIADKEQQETASKLRNLMSVYEANYDLVSIGAYKKGSNPVLDEAIDKIKKIDDFLIQKTNEAFDYEQTVRMMAEAIQ